MHLQGLAIDVKRQYQYVYAQGLQQPYPIQPHSRIEIARERVLHQQHTVARVMTLGVQVRQLFRTEQSSAQSRPIHHTVFMQHRRIHQFQHPLLQTLHPRRIHHALVGFGKARGHRQGVFQLGNRIIAPWTRMAVVIQLQKTRFEIGHVHFDRTLPRARLARQTATHGIVHLV